MHRAAHLKFVKMSHSSICHWYSRFSVLLLLPLAWNHPFSKPLPLSTPSHLQPGLIPYRFGGAGPWYTLLLGPPPPRPSPSAALLPFVLPPPSCSSCFFIIYAAIGSSQRIAAFNSSFISSSSACRAPSFTTPRKPFDIDISSGPENFSSPEQADNEDTPEAPRPTADFTGQDAKPAKKHNSLFNFYGRFAPSPGRGDTIRPKFSDAIARRVHKKRRRAQNLEKHLAVARRPSEDPSEDDLYKPTRPNEPPPQQMGRLTSLFSFIEQYPNAPALITKYFQTLANAAILTFAFYYLLCLVDYSSRRGPSERRLCCGDIGGNGRLRKELRGQ